MMKMVTTNSKISNTILELYVIILVIGMPCITNVILRLIIINNIIIELEIIQSIAISNIVDIFIFILLFLVETNIK